MTLEIIPNELERRIEELEEGIKKLEESTPSGVMRPTARAAAAPGWILCKGQAISRTTFAALFAAIGTTYGEGDKATTFNVPNGENRVMIGSGTHTRGAVGGEETVKITIGQMPEHKHKLLNNVGAPCSTAGEGFEARACAAGGGFNVTGNLANTGSISAVFETALEGKSESHNNMQPYFVGNWEIKE